MANLNRPFGLRPVRNGNGSPWTGEANMYVIIGNTAVDYRIGDVVKQGTTADIHGIPSVLKWAAGEAAADAPLGVIVGVMPVNHRPASLVGSALSLETKGRISGEALDRYVMVADSSDLVFEVQSDSTGISRDDVWLNATLTVTAGVDHSLSRSVLTAPATTLSLPFRIIGFSSRANNEINATAATDEPFAIALVRFNEHVTKIGVVTA